MTNAIRSQVSGVSIFHPFPNGFQIFLSLLNSFFHRFLVYQTCNKFYYYMKGTDENLKISVLQNLKE